MNKLTNKVAVVTGSSKGIGAAIAKALAAEGASVIVNYASSKEGADKVVNEITKAGGRAFAVGGSVSKAAEAQGIIKAAIQQFGRLDILVNNAGVYAMMPLEEVTEEEFHRQFNTNVPGDAIELGDGSLISASAVRSLRGDRRRVRWDDLRGRGPGERHRPDRPYLTAMTRLNANKTNAFICHPTTSLKPKNHVLCHHLF